MLPKLLLLYKLAQQCEKGKHASIASAASFPFTMNEIKQSFAEVATFRQKLFIWLLDQISGSLGLRRLLPRLSGRPPQLPEIGQSSQIPRNRNPYLPQQAVSSEFVTRGIRSL
jgi:hypothetical protein